MKTDRVQFSQSAIDLLDEIEREIRTILYRESSNMARLESDSVVKSRDVRKALGKVIDILVLKQAFLYDDSGPDRVGSGTIDHDGFPGRKTRLPGETTGNPDSKPMAETVGSYM